MQHPTNQTATQQFTAPPLRILPAAAAAAATTTTTTAISYYYVLYVLLVLLYLRHCIFDDLVSNDGREVRLGRMLALVWKELCLHTGDGASRVNDLVKPVVDDNFEAGGIGFKFNRGSIENDIQHETRENASFRLVL